MHLSIPEFDAELPIDAAFLIQTSPPSACHSNRLQALFSVGIVLHAVAFYLVFLFGEASSNQLTWGDAILFAQVALAGIWLAQGTSSPGLRVGGSLAFLILACYSRSYFTWIHRESAGSLLAPMLLISVPLLALRGWGWQFRFTVEAADHGAWRFGIRHLMLGTLGVAIFLAWARWAAEWLKRVVQGWVLSTEFALAAAFAAAVLAILYVIFGRGSVVARMLLLIVALAGASFVVASGLQTHTMINTTNVMNFLFVPMAIVAATLWTVRLRGFRVLRGKSPLIEVWAFCIADCAPPASVGPQRSVSRPSPS